ncbi:DUF2784 domain-containing protein [Nevskia sp.]|uniref:DUF2784 domain-containing protein n=1 Tax=Nevskia sp. TaxID=1929292 RepID=UPI0025E1B1A1|nr:DUF2784 domain-containing protein [Nevskia sp.]
MLARFAADAVLLLHLAFILFAVFGGLLVLWRARFAWLHLPALAWAVWVVGAHRECPLTALENHLLAAAGQAGYEGGFIEHYLLPLIYPPGLTAQQQTTIALAFAVWSLAIYALLLRQHWRRR